MKPQAGGIRRKAAEPVKRKPRRKRNSLQKRCRRSLADLPRQIKSLSENTADGWTDCSVDYLCEALRGPKGHEYRKAPCGKTLRNYLNHYSQNDVIEWQQYAGHYKPDENGKRRAVVRARLGRNGERFLRLQAELSNRGKSKEAKPSTPKATGKRKSPTENEKGIFPVVSVDRPSDSLYSYSTSSTSVTSAAEKEREAFLKKIASRTPLGSFEKIREHLRTIDDRLTFAPGLPGHLEVLLRRHGVMPSSPENPEATRGVA